MSLGLISALVGMLAARPSDAALPATLPAAPDAPPRRKPAQVPFADLAPFPHDSYEPFRDYRPGGRFGDPCRPW